MKTKDSNLETEIYRLGQEISQFTQDQTPSLFDKNAWIGRLLDQVMENPRLKVDLFRFVDVLPTLKDSKQIAEHVYEYLLKPAHPLAKFLSIALEATNHKLTRAVSTRLLKRSIQDLARRFILAATSKQAYKNLDLLRKQNLGFSLDLLGESTLSQSEATTYQKRYFELIEVIGQVMEQCSPQDPYRKAPQGLGNLSVKVSAFVPYLDPADMEQGLDHLEEMLLPILLDAKAKGIFVNFDLEQWQYHNLTYQLFERLALHPELADYTGLGVVIQTYLKSAEKDYQFLLNLAKRRGASFSVRLVKGAYWDYEVIYAGLHGYNIPVHLLKAETDMAYETLSARLLKDRQWLRPAFASHNLRSLCHVMALVQQQEIDPEEIEFQMLYGMSEPLSDALALKGYFVRLYCPIGDLLPGMSYLVRRLLENTSNSGFLRQTYQDHLSFDALIQSPALSIPALSVPTDTAETSAPSLQRTERQTPVFQNLAELDFAAPKQGQDFAAAIERVAESLPVRVPVVINGSNQERKDQESKDGEEGSRILKTHSPNDPSQAVAEVALASEQQAERAVQSAYQAWPNWRDQPVEARASLLDKLADLLERDRLELAALESIEAAKPWREADGDLVEAIDFCRYYAAQAREHLTPKKMGDLDGEENWMLYEGRGPAVILSPWNFPLAIFCGMAVAALVAGNPVLLKPSSNTCLMGYRFFQALGEAGFPKEVIQFLPGEGASIGRFLVEHPFTALIAFTGSKSVGLRILKRAGEVSENQPVIKKVIAEMGGKNAIIIDEDAEMDSAVSEVTRAAFGYAGQKCSAASRVVVVGSAYDEFIPRLIAAAGSLVLAPATSPHCNLGPVIDQVAFDRLQEVILKASQSEKMLYQGQAPTGGYFIAPHIFEVDSPDHYLLQTELFGPILTVIRAADFSEALKIAMNSQYFLTGAVFSRNPAHLEAAKKEFKVGNLYLNQSSTGAKVNRQPFGGFGMSGTGTKAGGPDYLMNFVYPRTITENQMRRGFAPSLLL